MTPDSLLVFEFWSAIKRAFRATIDDGESLRGQSK
jgi:hypothetical protein